jgi:hypothetical protein
VSAIADAYLEHVCASQGGKIDERIKRNHPPWHERFHIREEPFIDFLIKLFAEFLCLNPIGKVVPHRMIFPPTTICFLPL